MLVTHYFFQSQGPYIRDEILRMPLVKASIRTVPEVFESILYILVLLNADWGNKMIVSCVTATRFKVYVQFVLIYKNVLRTVFVFNLLIHQTLNAIIPGTLLKQQNELTFTDIKLHFWSHIFQSQNTNLCSYGIFQ